MSNETLSIGLLLAARLPLYLYVVYVGYRHKGSNTPLPFTALYVMGLLGCAIALISAFTELRVIRDILAGAFALILFLIAYSANQKIIRGEL